VHDKEVMATASREEDPPAEKSPGGAQNDPVRAREYLAAIVESSDDGIISKDLNGIIRTWNKSAQLLFGYTAEEAIGKPVTMLIPENRLDEEPNILRRIRAGERIDHYETVRKRKDGSLIDISITVSPIRNAYGEIVGASKIARDITERKRAEAQRNLLAAELSHRVKNTLATVMSIARRSLAPGEARDAFESRLRGLAQTHTRLAEAKWSGVVLDAIVRDELGLYSSSDVQNFHIEGPSVALNPKCALTLGLAIHELSTNAAKYGALSVPSGVVDVSWRVDAVRKMLSIDWRETGGPPVAPPKRSGFGRLLLERAVASDLAGDVKLEFDPVGLKCAITLPLRDNTIP
jgi:PAS domain S-box-containing protein